MNTVIRSLTIFLLLVPCTGFALGGSSFVRFEKVRGGFPMSHDGVSTPIVLATEDFPSVLIRLFQKDIAAVSGREPPLISKTLPSAREVIVVGIIGRSPLIDSLIREKKLNAGGVAGEWESYLVQIVNTPFPGIDRALVIAGSDKRGTAYGMFDLSEQMGVSPWYWWGDVPIRRHNNIFVTPGRHFSGPPSVRYRGIFLNDEDPDLTRWVMAKYGMVPPKENPPIPEGVANYGHEFYERIFELLLRLKGNYLWPAMWNNAFNEDDPENPKLANEYGIVMGTSHQEPMLRAQKEWDRRYLSTLGHWNYATQASTLESFWREGVRRNKEYESIVTIGLRGANDTPMAPGGPEANMALLEQIVGVQRRILREEVNPDITRIPQLWCLYKEVLDYYKAGMRVPDDVTLLWPDDNWGNLRRLPTAGERTRSGGAGVYYHFDYHGGPRSYQWINTNPIPKIWEQMSLAKEYGADRIWIVNVGHLKGYEFPIEYFMNLAWNTGRWTNSNIVAYTREWAAREFETVYADSIADIIARTTRFNGRCKPELLSPDTYSLVNYREAESVVADFKAITDKAERMYRKLPDDEKDAFYELVLFPAKASGIVNELYVSAGLNALYAGQGRAATNDMADKTRSLFAADTALMGYFNRSFAGGRWDHFMDQAHLGYTGWRDPPTNSLRAINLVDRDVPAGSDPGIAVEGSEGAWPESNPALPDFDPYKREAHYFEIFNRGTNPFDYLIAADRPWVIISSPSGIVQKQTRIWVSIDWNKKPAADSSGRMTIRLAGKEASLIVAAPRRAPIDSPRCFVEGNGYVSMEAEHYSGKEDSPNGSWIRIEQYGSTRSAMRTTAPIDAPIAIPGKNSALLEYRMFLFRSGTVTVTGTFGPSLNFIAGHPVRYAISFDDDPPQEVTLVPAAFDVQNSYNDWARTVVRNARTSTSTHTLATAGYHSLKLWMIDPGVVLEKIVVDLGGVKKSYLGPPESYVGGMNAR